MNCKISLFCWKIYLLFGSSRVYRHPFYRHPVYRHPVYRQPVYRQPVYWQVQFIDKSSLSTASLSIVQFIDSTVYRQGRFIDAASLTIASLSTNILSNTVARLGQLKSGRHNNIKGGLMYIFWIFNIPRKIKGGPSCLFSKIWLNHGDSRKSFNRIIKIYFIDFKITILIIIEYKLHIYIALYSFMLPL